VVNGVPKISDLGSSKELRDPNSNSPYVVSRLYRAPELIMGLNYELNIDVWSLGVMLFEMVTGHTPFNGKTEGLQLYDIFENLGSPSDLEFKRLASRCNYDKTVWEKLKNIPCNPRFWLPVQKEEPTGVLQNLLLKCFRYVPEDRISAQGMLDHSFFSLHSQNKTKSN